MFSKPTISRYAYEPYLGQNAQFVVVEMRAIADDETSAHLHLIEIRRTLQNTHFFGDFTHTK